MKHWSSGNCKKAFSQRLYSKTQQACWHSKQPNLNLCGR